MANLLRFGLPLSLWLTIYYESLHSMVTVWAQSKTYEHSFLILPISLWVVWQDRERFKAQLLSTAWIPVILLVFPSLLWMIGRTANISMFEHIAAITSLQLILWALIGHSLAKAFYFPILYLGFCIPFGEELVPYLQSITADISVAAVQLTGIPIYRDGLYLTIPNGRFEVAEACSGIRFLISSIALGTLFAYHFFSKTWKQILFVGFSIIFPIIANGIRAYGIIVIGHFSDMQLATGADHLVYGWVFFSIVIAIIFYIASLFSDKLPEEKVASTELNQAQPVTKTASVVVCVFSIISVIGIWESSITTDEQNFSSPIILPIDATEMTSSSWGISFPNAQLSVLAESENDKAEFYSAKYSLTQQDGELISSKNQLFDKNRWALNSRKSIQLSKTAGDPIQSTRLNLVSPTGNVMNVLYWYCINDYCSNSKLKLKLYKAYWLITGKVGYAEIYAVSSRELSDDKLSKLATNWISKDSKKE